MPGFFSSFATLASGHEWLVTANFILSALLTLWIVRYRNLYLAARRHQANTDAMIDNLSEGIYRSDPDGRQMKANAALVRLNGYDSEAEMLASVHDIAREWYVLPQRRAEFKDLLESNGRVVDFVSEIYRHKTRERIWVTESARLVRDEATGRTLYYEGSVREITETVKRLELEEKFSKLMREVPGALFQCTVTPGESGVVNYLSPGFERLSGIAADAHIANWRAFLDRIPEQDRVLYSTHFAPIGTAPAPFELEHRYVCPNGREKWLRVSATPEVDGKSVIWHGYMSDVTLRRNNQLAAERLAYFDTLTGLPNRRAFLDRMAHAVARCREANGRGAVLFIDLDNFKALNDTQGHDVGDKYLKQVAQRLGETIGEAGTVARIGGDEFVIVVEAIDGDSEAAARHAVDLGNRITAAMRRNFEIDAIRHRASASIGIVVFDGLSATPEEILKHADLAMYEAKSAGRDGLSLYDPATMDREAERYRLLADLRDTLGRGGDELQLHYQPQVGRDGKVTAAEALIRWNHPQRGTVMPDSFIPLAEQSGLIGEISRFVLAEAVKRLAQWDADPRLRRLGLAVNLSVKCFQNDDMPPFLAGLLARHRVDGGRLTIEVTEHVMARDQEQIAGRLDRLKQLGVRLSLDDFGTGYSSLTYLKRLPFDEVKIDGSFVADIETAESDRVLVKTILAMAHTLGLNAVAEHVETPAQEAFLREHGCQCFQGWLYSKALPAGAFDAFVRALTPMPRDGTAQAASA